MTDSVFPEHPWIEPGDRLVVPGKPTSQPRSNAERLLAEGRGGHDYTLRQGYLEAGKLIALAIQTDAMISPGIIFPMLYCFRHHLELSLKAAIEEFAKLTRRPVPPKLAGSHDLLALWKEFRSHEIEAVGESPEDAEINEAMEQCIRDMDELDKTSQAFRYTADRSGIEFVHSVQVEVARISETMVKLRNGFEGAMDYADHLQSLHDESAPIGGE